MQVVVALLVSVLSVGMKSTAASQLVQVIERRKELKVNLSLLRRSLEDDDLVDWLGDVAHDTAQRQATIDALASDQAYTAAEERQLEKGEAMFAEYDGSSATATQLKRSGTIARSETKLDEAGRLLLGRAEAEVRVSPQAYVAYMLNYDGRHIHADYDPATDAIVPRMLAKVSDHHVIVFLRKKLGSGLHDRCASSTSSAISVSWRKCTGAACEAQALPRIRTQIAAAGRF